MTPSTLADDLGPATPFPGLIDEAGAIRATCRVCGKCDALVRDLMQDVAVAGTNVGKQTRQPAAAPA